MNQKSLPLAILFIWCTLHSAIAQDTLNPEWVVTKSSPVPNGNAEAWAIGSDQDGNLFWGVNKDMPGLFEFMNAFIYKLDADSNVLWLDTAVTGTFAQQSYNLKVSDVFIYAAGRTCSALGTDSCDALLFTTDATDGSSGWSFVWDGGYGYEEIDGIALATDGIYLTGWSAGDGTAIDLLLMKIDYAGNLIWQTTWGSAGNRDDHQDGHVVVDDSMIYVSGLYNGSPGLGWDGQALLAAFSKVDGSLVDSVTYGRQDTWFNAENALGMTTDGTDLYVTGYTTTSANNWDIFVAKFDKNLNELWYTTWGGTAAAESARAITVTPDGSVYVGGTTESYGNGEMDIVLLKLDASGNTEWYKTWGGTNDDQTLDIHLRDNQLYLTGKTASFHPTQKWEAILLKVAIDSLVSVPEANGASTKMWFSPNPMTASAQLNYANPTNAPHQLMIYDVGGRKVRAVNNITTKQISIEKRGLENGIYFFQLVNNGEQVGSGKLIIQ